MRPRFSRFAPGLRVGADVFTRHGLALPAGTAAARGIVDRMTDLANPSIDVSKVHPAIVSFFEETSSLELHVRSRWRFPFSVGWRLLRPVMRWIGQFVLPRHEGEGRILTRTFGLDGARDGREGARGLVRTYADSGEVMQAVAYATWERQGVRYMSASFPLPGGQLSGILRLDVTSEDDDGRLAVALSSAARDGDDACVWLVVGPFALPSPFGERIDLWAPGMRGAPPELEPPALDGATIVGRHEQRLFGIRFATHLYWFRPL
jgi:hypothetical protein